MSRKVKPGLLYYSMDVDHTTNRRIRLLMNEFDTDGYWIWQCIVSQCYKENGYYFSMEESNISILASDVARKTPELILRVIDACCKRGLFDTDLLRKENVLSNDRMQVDFITATRDRRRKGSKLYFDENYFLISPQDFLQFTKDQLINIFFLHSGKEMWTTLHDSMENTLFLQGKKTDSTESSLFPRRNTDNSRYRVDKSRYINTNVLTEKSDPEEINGNHVVGNTGKDEAIAGLATKGGKRVRKPAAKKNPDSEPYWHLIRRKWIDFNRTHLMFDVEPIPKEDYSHIHKIIIALRTRAEIHKVVWTEPVALERWEKFLTVAYTQDDWLKNNFLPLNLRNQMQTIFKLIEKPDGNRNTGNKSGKAAGTSSSGVGKDIKFDKA